MDLPNLFKRNAAFFIFFAALGLYAISAGVKLDEQSKTPHHVYLADSLMRGHVDLVALPASKFDLISFNGKWFVAGELTPALLLIPFVALFGTGVSDILFGVVVGALNVALMYSLLGCVTQKMEVHLWLLTLFAVGTVHWWVSSVGSVWFNAHLVALLFMILYARSAIRDLPLSAGIFLGLAALSRPPTLFSALFFFTLTVARHRDAKVIFRKLIPFGAALGAAVAVMLAYNYLRFGSPMDFGYLYVQGTGALTDAHARTGWFNIRYMPCNIYVALLGAPNIGCNPLPGVNQACPHLEPVTRVFSRASSFFNPLGMSMFLTTPAFLLVFRAKLRDDYVIPAWAGMTATLMVLWMYHTTGFVQFGYRYILDVAVFLFILLGRAVDRIGALEKILIGLSVIMGAVGLYLMYYMNFGLFWHKMFVDLARRVYRFILKAI